MENNIDLLRKQKIETHKFVRFLEECKYSGSLDNKVDINLVIGTILKYISYVDSLISEIFSLKQKIITLENQIKDMEKNKDNA